MTPEYIVIHTAGPVDEFGNNVLVYQSFETVRDFHVKTRGWVDIGYHKYVDRDGTVHDGRALNVRGAHVEGLNYRSVGICCAGNGDLADFTDEQKRAVATITAQLMRMYDIPIGRVLGHRECFVIPGVKNTGKSCPGSKVDMDEIRRLTLLAFDAPEPRAPEVVPAIVAPPRFLDTPIVKEVPMPVTKPWWQSKTIWLGMMQTAVGIGEVISQATYLGSEVTGIAVTVCGVLTVALRVITSQPVSLK